MKRLIIALFMMWLIANGNADYFNVTIDGETWETVCPLVEGDFYLDFLSTGTHCGCICPHLYEEHISVPAHFCIKFKDNKKLELWEMIPQPGDDEYFNPDLLKVKVKK